MGNDNSLADIASLSLMFQRAMRDHEFQLAPRVLDQLEWRIGEDAVPVILSHEAFSVYDSPRAITADWFATKYGFIGSFYSGLVFVDKELGGKIVELRAVHTGACITAQVGE